VGFLGGLTRGIITRLGIRKSEEKINRQLSNGLYTGAKELHNRGLIDRELAERTKAKASTL